MSYEFPPAGPHGELEQLFEDVFFVTGTVCMKAGPTLAFSRNMTVVRHGEELTLINSVRLDEAGLAKLDALGRVTHVLRICGFHGMDDPFYKDRYDATVWTIDGMRYAKGFDVAKPEARTYFDADEVMTASTQLPIPGARLVRFESANPPEGLILIEREGGILVSGDCLQNYAGPDTYFNLMGRIVMRMMGFFKPHNIGPGWLKSVKPDVAEIRSLLDVDFEHVLPVHGAPVIGGAKTKFRPAIERVAGA